MGDVGRAFELKNRSLFWRITVSFYVVTTVVQVIVWKLHVSLDNIYRYISGSYVDIKAGCYFQGLVSRDIVRECYYEAHVSDVVFFMQVNALILFSLIVNQFLIRWIVRSIRW